MSGARARAGAGVGVTPKERQHKGLGRPTQSKSSQHYLPHQSLFDREHILDNLDDHENVSLNDFEDDSTHENEFSSPAFDSTELNLLSYYGPSDRRPQPPQSSPKFSIHTPNSGKGAARQTNYCTPHSQIFQPSSQPQNDMMALLQQQGMLQKVLSQQKDMQDQQNVLMDKQQKLEKKIQSLEESILSSGSDGQKQKARVTRQLTVSIVHYVSLFLFNFTTSYILLQNLVAEASDALEDDFHSDERCALY